MCVCGVLGTATVNEHTKTGDRMSIVYSRVSERASERAPLTEQSRAAGGFGPTQPLFIAPPSVRPAIDCRVLNIKRRFIKIESLKPSTSYACNSSRSIPKMPSPQVASAVTTSDSSCRPSPALHGSTTAAGCVHDWSMSACGISTDDWFSMQD